MRSIVSALAISLLTGAAMYAADAPAPPPTVGGVLDRQLAGAERDIVPLAEAMPADKYSFAPSGEMFAGVRTFGEQARHIAFVLYAVSSAALGEKNPSEAGKNENGPDSLKSKEEIVKYLKDAFAYAHKAANSLTAANMLQMVDSPFGPGKTSKLNMANIATWHSFDHYGQMVVYARMNAVVPPASKQ
jgi:hypothetical protein